MDMEIILNSQSIYDAKIRSGKYDHYGPELRDVLFEDCLQQAAMMHHINSRGRRHDG